MKLNSYSREPKLTCPRKYYQPSLEEALNKDQHLLFSIPLTKDGLNKVIPEDRLRDHETRQVVTDGFNQTYPVAAEPLQQKLLRELKNNKT